MGKKMAEKPTHAEPIDTQALMTSCALLCTSAFPRWTLAKSRLAELSTEVCELAEPPPRPISIVGPPNTMINDPG